MTTFYLGRDAYNGYSYGLFEVRPRRRIYRRENEKGSGGTLGFSSQGRSCVLNDLEVEWIFGKLDLEVGDVIEVEINIKGDCDE